MFCTEWTFYAEFSLRHWGKACKIWEIFFSKWVFSFLFFAFRSEFRFCLVFHFLFWFQCIFSVKFPPKLKKKTWHISEIFKSPKIFEFCWNQKVFSISVKAKLLLFFNSCFGFNALQCQRYWRKFLKCLRSWNFRKKIRFETEIWIIFIKFQISGFLILVSDWVECFFEFFLSCCKKLKCLRNWNFSKFFEFFVLNQKCLSV